MTSAKRASATTTTRPALPTGVKESDLTRPDFRKWTGPYAESVLDLWYVVGRGWCIPTLYIGSSHRQQWLPRTYGVAMDGSIVTMGGGPHVTHTVKVYNRTARAAALKPLFALKAKGELDASTIRNRIGSRRAQGQLERMAGKSYWRWNS